MTTVTEAFELPRPDDIRAMGFVIKLREADPRSEEVRQLVEDYVVTPAVEKEQPRILDDMKQVFDRGEEYGRFIHGSFGSGKSHFMTILALLIETAAPAWKKFQPLLNVCSTHIGTRSTAKVVTPRACAKSPCRAGGDVRIEHTQAGALPPPPVEVYASRAHVR